MTARIEAMQAEIRENESLDPVLKATRDAHEADVAMEEEKAAAARRAEQAAEDAELWHQADRIVWKSRGEDVMEAQERRKQLEMERKQKERAAKRGVAASAVSSKPAKARPKTDREKREEEQKKAERDREVQAQVDKLRAARLLQEQERKRKEAEVREAEFENSIAELSNGVYEGAFLDGKRHGLGTRRYGNGDVYTGGWKEGKKSGHGNIRFADSSFFSGHFHQGLCLSLSACPPLCVATCLFCCVRVWKRACVSVTCARYAERERCTSTPLRTRQHTAMDMQARTTARASWSATGGTDTRAGGLVESARGLASINGPTVHGTRAPTGTASHTVWAREFLQAAQNMSASGLWA